MWTSSPAAPRASIVTLSNGFGANTEIRGRRDAGPPAAVLSV